MNKLLKIGDSLWIDPEDITGVEVVEVPGLGWPWRTKSLYRVRIDTKTGKDCRTSNTDEATAQKFAEKIVSLINQGGGE